MQKIELFVQGTLSGEMLQTTSQTEKSDISVKCLHGCFLRTVEQHQEYENTSIIQGITHGFLFKGTILLLCSQLNFSF